MKPVFESVKANLTDIGFVLSVLLVGLLLLPFVRSAAKKVPGVSAVVQ